MNAIDVAQNIKESVPLVLFIHIYFEAFLKFNTLDSIIINLLMSGTCTYNPTLHAVNPQTEVVPHIPALKVTRSNLDTGTHLNLSRFQFLNSTQHSFLKKLLFNQTTNHERFKKIFRFWYYQNV